MQDKCRSCKHNLAENKAVFGNLDCEYQCVSVTETNGDGIVYACEDYEPEQPNVKRISVVTDRMLLVDVTVDLNSLSPLARVLAESVCTTEHADDLSCVTLEGPLTVAERYIKENPARAEEYEKLWELPGDRTTKERIRFWWRKMKAEESPEAFFERMAGIVINTGAVAVAAPIRYEITQNREVRDVV